MSGETVTISKEEYQRLKRLEKVDRDLIEQLIKSLEDVKAGRIKRVA
jgi:hypothetical protein